MIIIIVILLILGILGIMVLCSWVGAWLWNITLPYLFGLPHVEWWHILALIILLWILIPHGHIIKIGSEDD